MAEILNCNDNPKGKKLTEKECGEIYNALEDRRNQLRKDLEAADLPERIREALEKSLETCEQLAEVFE